MQVRGSASGLRSRADLRHALGVIGALMAIMKIGVTGPALGVIACMLLPACATDPRPAVSAAVTDSVPTWLGGMPKDVPPRPGTPEYEAWQKKRAEESAAIKTR